MLVLQDHAPGRLRLPLLLYGDKAELGWSVCSRERSPTHAEVTVVILPALRHSRIHFPQLFSPPSSTGQRCEPRGAQWLWAALEAVPVNRYRGQLIFSVFLNAAFVSRLAVETCVPPFSIRRSAGRWTPLRAALPGCLGRGAGGEALRRAFQNHIFSSCVGQGLFQNWESDGAGLWKSEPMSLQQLVLGFVGFFHKAHWRWQAFSCKLFWDNFHQLQPFQSGRNDLCLL